MPRYIERETLGEMLVRLHREGDIETCDLEAVGRAFTFAASRRKAQRDKGTVLLEAASRQISTELLTNSRPVLN